MAKRGLTRKINQAYGWMFGLYLQAYYDRQYKALYKRLDNPYRPTSDEVEAYKKRWAGLGYRVNPIYYKVFSSLLPADLDFIPEDISHNTIEPLINPVRYRGYYEDKNNFDRILGGGQMVE